jgi:hypothetical protein
VTEKGGEKATVSQRRRGNGSVGEPPKSALCAESAHAGAEEVKKVKGWSAWQPGVTSTRAKIAEPAKPRMTLSQKPTDADNLPPVDEPREFAFASGALSLCTLDVHNDGVVCDCYHSSVALKIVRS